MTFTAQDVVEISKLDTIKSCNVLQGTRIFPAWYSGRGMIIHHADDIQLEQFFLRRTINLEDYHLYRILVPLMNHAGWVYVHFSQPKKEYWGFLVKMSDIDICP